MGHRDGGEDCAEGPPGRSDLRLGRPKRAGADNARRETIKSQGNISAGVAEEAAGHVPKRSAQQEPKHQIRQRCRPVQTSNILRLQGDRPQPERGRGNQVPERRMMRIVAVGLERGVGVFVSSEVGGADRTSTSVSPRLFQSVLPRSSR